MQGTCFQAGVFKIFVVRFAQPLDALLSSALAGQVHYSGEPVFD